MSRTVTVLALVVFSTMIGTGYGYETAFDDATTHWMFGSDGTRLEDNNAPGTTLGIIWAGESPWGNASNGFISDKDGFVHLRLGGTRRLFVSSAAAAAELKFSESITTWTRIQWDGGRATPITRVMGTHGGSPNWGWQLGIPGGTYDPCATATEATFYVSDDGSTNWVGVSADYAFETDAWYDIAGTFDHTTGDVSVYVIDPYTSEMLASNTVSSSLRSLNTPDEEFRILSPGYEVGTQYVNIESAAVWDRSLRATELMRLATPNFVLFYENFEEVNGFSDDGQVDGVNGWVCDWTDPCAMITRAGDSNFNTIGALAACPIAGGRWAIMNKGYGVQSVGRLEWNMAFNIGESTMTGYSVGFYIHGESGDNTGMLIAEVVPNDSTFKVQWKDSSDAEVIPPLTKTFAEVGFVLNEDTWYRFKVTYDIARDALSVDICEDGDVCWINIYSGTSAQGRPVSPRDVSVHSIGAHLAVDEVLVSYFPAVCGDPHTEYIAADLNRDCWVDIEDVSLLSSGWLNCTDPAVAGCE